jgi:general secretion pathway protein M
MSLKQAKPMATARQALAQRWQALSGREQTLLRWGAALLLVASVWWLLVAPALRTVREAPAQQAALDTQWQQLQDLQAQAQSLQQQPRMSQAEALRALQKASTDLLGASAQLQTVGDRSTVTLKAVPAEALGLWLAQVRMQARAVPVQAQLQRSAGADKATPGLDSKSTNPPAATAATAATWSGSVVLSLPAP